MEIHVGMLENFECVDEVGNTHILDIVIFETPKRGVVYAYEPGTFNEVIFDFKDVEVQTWLELVRMQTLELITAPKDEKPAGPGKNVL